MFSSVAVWINSIFHHSFMTSSLVMTNNSQNTEIKINIQKLFCSICRILISVYWIKFLWMNKWRNFSDSEKTCFFFYSNIPQHLKRPIKISIVYIEFYTWGNFLVLGQGEGNFCPWDSVFSFSKNYFFERNYLWLDLFDCIGYYFGITLCMIPNFNKFQLK